MNIQIKTETIQPDPITTKVAEAVTLLPEQLDGLVELMIQAGGMSATERITSQNLQSLTITADSYQATENDHTVFKPCFKVSIVLK